MQVGTVGTGINCRGDRDCFPSCFFWTASQLSPWKCPIKGCISVQTIRIMDLVLRWITHDGISVQRGACTHTRTNKILVFKTAKLQTMLRKEVPGSSGSYQVEIKTNRDKIS